MTASQRINPDWECTPADIQERIKAKEDAAGRFMFAPLPASEKNWKR